MRIPASLLGGAEAGMHAEDTKCWQAGCELGQKLGVRDTKELVKENIQKSRTASQRLRQNFVSHTET